MRITFGILFLVIIAALAVCAILARKSGKHIGNAVSLLLVCLIFPLFGNGMIIVSGNKTVSLIGCYMYYLGLDLSIAALLHYTYVYLRITEPDKRIQYTACLLILVDMIQLLLNSVLHHAFDVTQIEVDGFAYYKMIPLLGQQFHRVVDYLLLAGIIAAYIVTLYRAPRLQAERYGIILFALLLVSVWETVYIAAGTPIDRSMIGYGVFGLLCFYFSLYYRPLRLLDRMLSGMVSGQENPVFFFDESQRCIWMNRAGEQFLNLNEHELEEVEGRLKKEFGSLRPDLMEWKDAFTICRNGEKHYIELIKQPLLDSRQKTSGFYFHIYDHDLTDEQRVAEQKLFNARHDQLTGLFNRDYLYERTKKLLAENPEETYLILTAEITDLKVINDLYGNTFGDQALKYAAEWLHENENINQNGVTAVWAVTASAYVSQKRISVWSAWNTRFPI